MVALARTEMWSQPPYKQKAMSLRTQVFFLPKTLPLARKSSLVHTAPPNRPRWLVYSLQCRSPSPAPWVPEVGHPCDGTLSPGSGHGSPGLCWQSPRPGTELGWSSWPSCRGDPRPRCQSPAVPSPGPAVPQTLCAHCWTRAPNWSPGDSWG